MTLCNRERVRERADIFRLLKALVWNSCRLPLEVSWLLRLGNELDFFWRPKHSRFFEGRKNLHFSIFSISILNYSKALIFALKYKVWFKLWFKRFSNVQKWLLLEVLVWNPSIRFKTRSEKNQLNEVVLSVCVWACRHCRDEGKIEFFFGWTHAFVLH